MALDEVRFLHVSPPPPARRPPPRAGRCGPAARGPPARSVSAWVGRRAEGAFSITAGVPSNRRTTTVKAPAGSRPSSWATSASSPSRPVVAIGDSNSSTIVVQSARRSGPLPTSRTDGQRQNSRACTIRETMPGSFGRSHLGQWPCRRVAAGGGPKRPTRSSAGVVVVVVVHPAAARRRPRE